MGERSAPAVHNGAVERFEQRDWLAASILCAVSFAMRVPFRSQYAYHWDSAQFALAIEHYDVSLGLPHLPGFFLYVMFGRIVNILVGDPHASLVWMSVLAGATLAGLGYLLAATLFGRDCGWATGCLLASSPLCWFQSEVALTTIVDSALVVATVLICWKAIGSGGGWRWVIAMAVMLTLVAGIRQQSALLLFPLWLYTFWRFPSGRLQRAGVGIILVGLLCAAWFIPMVKLSGGLGGFWELYPARLKLNAAYASYSGRGFEALGQNLAFIVANCWMGLSAAALLAGAECTSWLMSDESRRQTLAQRGEPLRFVAIWFLPMFAFGAIVFTAMSGHVLNYFPSIVILIGLTLGRLVRKITHHLQGLHTKFVDPHRLALVSVIGGVTLVNVGMFLLPPGWTAWLRENLSLTATNIREHDRQLGQWFQEIRSHYHPADVLICHSGEYLFWGFRLFQYHLPEYENCLLTPDPGIAPALTNKLWYAKDWHVEFVDRFEARGRKELILVVPPGETLDLFTNAFDVTTAKKWEIADSLPLYILTPTAEWW
jgi:hypothetical protein